MDVLIDGRERNASSCSGIGTSINCRRASLQVKVVGRGAEETGVPHEIVGFDGAALRRDCARALENIVLDDRRHGHRTIHHNEGAVARIIDHRVVHHE
jgi:hypothetical protein